MSRTEVASGADSRDGPGLRWWIEGVAPWLLGLLCGLGMAEHETWPIVVAVLCGPGLVRYGRRVARDMEARRLQR